jgi:hypothetical protein
MLYFCDNLGQVNEVTLTTQSFKQPHDTNYKNSH